MNVLMVNMALDAATGGGTAARTLQSARALTEIGVHCRIATTGRGTDHWPDVPGVEVVRLRAGGGRFRVPIAGFHVLQGAVTDADVVLLVNHWTSINVAAYRATRRSRKPYVVSPAGALSLTGRSRRLKMFYDRAYGRRIIRDAAGHIAVTADEARQFEPYGIAAERVTVVPNGMPSEPPGDPGRFRSSVGVGDAPFLLFLGRLAPIKGPDLLVRAFGRVAASCPGWHLIVAGPDDGMQHELEGLLGRVDLRARVHLVGFLDARGKSDAIAASDVVVVPSRREAMSIVVLEAAALGRPAIVTDACGIPDVATSGGGWVVPPSEDDLAAAIRAATADRAALRTKGAVWKRYASERYSWAHVARLYRDLFEHVTGRA
jgi:glycosyltransferase involved in cell wall biosynthesis